MRYKIVHKTIYTYNQSVLLQPHLLRLRPRCDVWQKLQACSISVEPEAAGISEINDLDDNNCIKLWFTEPTESLKVQVNTQIETNKHNPFDYLLEPWAIELPFDYPNSLQTQLNLYLQPYYSLRPDPTATQLAQEIYQEVTGNTISFLSVLNQRIYDNCEYIVRDTGEPWFPGTTWQSKRGSCRDFTVLFMEVCRAIGLGARFVSGYQEGDPNQEQRDLHAWAEVYLPGAGWRGYDPTLGLAVADRHIALAASPSPTYAAPISGTVLPVQPIFVSGKAVESQMETHISIEVVEI